MSEIIERVAAVLRFRINSLDYDDADGEEPYSVQCARWVLEALREPTPEMLVELGAFMHEPDPAAHAAAYRAAIDAALNETPSPSAPDQQGSGAAAPR